MIGNGFVSPDFKVNQYSVLKNAGEIDLNVEKHFSFSSVHGKGKIYIDGSEHGSKVTCVSDREEPANGVAGCLRNYLRVQGYKVKHEDKDGVLYTDMNPGKLVLFIKDLGMFSGFKEDVNEGFINEGWKDEFIKDNSYTNTEEYRKALSISQKLREEHDREWEEYKKAEDWLKKNGTPKPKEEWDEDDEFEALLHNKPMKYKDEKEASKYKSLKEKSLKKCTELDHAWTEASEKVELLKLKAREIEKKQYNFNKPKKATKKKYKGFKTETGIPYYDDRMKSGKGYVAEMSPKEYLLRCALQIFPCGTIESTVNGCIDANCKKYASKMKSGTDFDMPYLNFTQGEQEGRHRAVAAMLNGYDLIPVYII